MADNRFNQVPGYGGGGGGGGFQVGPQNPAMHGVPGMTPYMQTGMPMNPMMQQQMMMASGMRFPMQGMRMGPPNTPPPPYGMQSPNPGVTSIPNRPRMSLSKSKGGQQSEKERFFEEQRQRLKQFGKPGTAKVDADKLIGSMFSSDTKPQPGKGKAQNAQMNDGANNDDDDGFGDFLQGPSVSDNKGKENIPAVIPAVEETAPPEPEPEHHEEKKDLKSMMLEYSDLSAPKKAKGFHKPTLNEVQKSHGHHHHGHHHHHKVSTTNFHESDHARSWKQHTEDLEGLFQLPVMPKKPPAAAASQPHHVVYAPQHVMATGVPPASMAAFSTGSVALVPPSGPPPTYHDVAASSGIPAAPTNLVASNHVSPAVSHSYPGDPAQPGKGPGHLPDWCAHSEEQVPPVYKQVLEASLVDNKISTERLYPILLLSGLPREKLAHIWSLCNTATPGQLIKNELWMVLALIALTQNQYDTNSADILARCPVAPVPMFHTQEVSSPATLPTTPQQHQPHPHHQPTSSLTAISGAPTASMSAAANNIPHHPQPQHRVQHPQPHPPPEPATAAAMSGAKNMAGADDDDFADFQAAAPAMNSGAVSVGKGHTSPSFEDDEFTDGRDSLSQVSTSEQSENEDIRNFESYVEEFNQKKERPDGSPLHCPFPSIQQTSAMKTTKGQQTHGSGNSSVKAGSHAKIDTTFLSSAAIHEKDSAPHGSGLNQSAISNIATSLADSDFTDFKSAPSSSKVPSGLPAAPGSGSIQAQGDDADDFADFKSASLQTSTTSGASSSNEVSLIGDEDKYGALRVLTLDSDFTQPSLFESSGHSSSAGGASKQGTTQGDGVSNEEDDWADFSAAPATDESLENQMSSSTMTPGEISSGPKKSASNKDDILKLFNSSSPVKGAAIFTSGNSSDVTSEGGSKNGSLFGDEPSSSSTPSKSRGLDSSMSGDHPSFGSFNDQDSTIGGPGWSKADSGPAEDWASFSKDDNRVDHHHLSDKPSLAGFPGNTGLSSASFVSSFGSTNSMSNTEDEWGDYSHKPTGRETDNKWGGPSNVANADEDNWSDFSGAGSASGVGKSDAGKSKDDEGANFVTIKKQNLGTNEIMGLFKVRDDPATLSSYQLPPQQPSNRHGSRHSKGSYRSGGDGHGRRISSDLDDEGPPPMDFNHDEDYDDHAFSRGYDLDDFMQRAPPATTYSPFGVAHSSPVYSRAGGVNKLKDNKEDSGSVNSLDLPSTRPADPSGSDSQSVSSADLTSGDMTGGGTGAVSVESKSLDSLDFRMENGEGESADGTREENAAPPPATSQQSQHHPIQPQELLASMPDFADKYNIEREAQGSDRYGHEWERCLTNSCRVISEANTLFNTISSSSVCNEVLKSAQGSEYVTSVIEIYRVVCRVMTSMRSTAISTTELEQTLKNIDLAWNNLTAFLVGASLLPEQSTLVFTNCVLKSDSDHAQNLACGLCLLSVDSKPLVTPSQSAGTGSINSCKLTYAGRQYHATCANFWVNCVDQTLPSLTLPELL